MRARPNRAVPAPAAAHCLGRRADLAGDVARDAFVVPDADIVSAFGQTEMSPLTCALVGSDSEERIGSVGRPIPHIQTRVVDAQLNDAPRLARYKQPARYELIAELPRNAGGKVVKGRLRPA